MAKNQLSQIFEIKINKTALKRHCHASFNLSNLSAKLHAYSKATFLVNHTDNINRPYSYSHGCTGNEHEREADAGKSFQMQIISPA